MDAIICPMCGSENPTDAAYCGNCRLNLKLALKDPGEIKRALRDSVPRPSPEHSQALGDIPSGLLVQQDVRRPKGVLQVVLLEEVAGSHSGNPLRTAVFCILRMVPARHTRRRQAPLDHVMVYRGRIGVPCACAGGSVHDLGRRLESDRCRSGWRRSSCSPWTVGDPQAMGDWLRHPMEAADRRSQQERNPDHHTSRRRGVILLAAKLFQLSVWLPGEEKKVLLSSPDPEVAGFLKSAIEKHSNIQAPLSRYSGR